MNKFILKLCSEIQICLTGTGVGWILKWLSDFGNSTEKTTPARKRLWDRDMGMGHMHELNEPYAWGYSSWKLTGIAKKKNYGY